MQILDISDKDRSLDYVNKLIVHPLVVPGHLALDEFDIKQLSDIVQDALLNTKSIQSLQSSFGHYTKNWGVDWYWIAHHISWDYYNIKQAKMLLRFQGNSRKVYKQVEKTDSPEAWGLYLRDSNDFNSEPKLFSLDELIANGSNLGKGKNEWKPVIGVTDFGFRKFHPYDNPEWEEVEHYWDKTSLKSMSDSDIWDAIEKRYKTNPNPPPLTQRQKKIRSLIKITINGKQIDLGDK